MSGLAGAAAEVLAEAGLDQYIWDEITTLYPGTDFHDGVLYISIPIQRNVMKEKGKGKNAVMVPDIELQTMCVTSDGQWFPFTPEELREREFAYPEYFVQRRESNWPLGDVRLFLEGKAPEIDGLELYNALRNIYIAHIEYVEDMHYAVVPLYVMGSYLYRMFDAIGFLHFNGTAASGKSQNLRLLKAFGFNTSMASNMSTASLFRMAAGNPGIMCIDEAESFEGERGQEIRLILNSAYMSTANVTRAEKPDPEGSHQATEFKTFGPKVLASINTLEPVIQSRCLVIHMAPAIREIPEFREDDKQWNAIRRQLYWWAMQNAGAINELRQAWNTNYRWTRAKNLVNRSWQISQMLIVLADYIGGDAMVNPLIAYLEGYFAQSLAANESADRQRLLLKVLPRLFATKQPQKDAEWWALTDIRDVLIAHLDEDVREYAKSRSVSRHLGSLGFKDRRPGKGGTLVRLTEDEVRAQMKRRRVEPFEDDQAWFDGRDYGIHLVTEQPAAPQDELSWLDEVNSGADYGNPPDPD